MLLEKEVRRLWQTENLNFLPCTFSDCNFILLSTSGNFPRRIILLDEERELLELNLFSPTVQPTISTFLNEFAFTSSSEFTFAVCQCRKRQFFNSVIFEPVTNLHLYFSYTQFFFNITINISISDFTLFSSVGIP